MLKFVDLQQGSQQWLDFRCHHIGASDAPIVMNVSPWKTPRQLAKEKWGVGPARYISQYMRRGIDLETTALQKFCGGIGSYSPCVVVSTENPFLMASLDGYDKHTLKGVEIKCPGPKDHGTALGGEIPEKYFPQLQHQMYVCELSEISYFSFDGTDGVTLMCSRDDDYIKTMLEQHNKFWYYVENFILPPHKIKCKTVLHEAINK